MNNLSIESMRSFISSGSYNRLKNEEHKLKLLKCMIRDEQDRLGIKHMKWREAGVVGEFVINKTYKYKHMELNSLFYDLGILPTISYLDIELLSDEEAEMVKPFQIPGDKYVRYFPNKQAEKNFADTKNELGLFSVISLNDKVALWKRSFLMYSTLNKEWQRERKIAAALLITNSLEKVTFELGTISLMEAPARLGVDRVFELLKAETLLICSRVDLSKLIELTARGFISQSQLNMFREVTSIERKYILMTFQKLEEKRLYWHSRLGGLSKLSLP